MTEEDKKEIQEISRKFKRISKDLFEERKLLYPSHYKLESAGTEIKQLLKEIKIENEEFKFWKSWKIKEIENFIVDLAGKLHHDYDKQLKRYREKWTIEKEKIDKLIIEFEQKFVNLTDT